MSPRSQPVLRAPVLERTAAVILALTLDFSVLSVFVSSLWPIGAAQSLFFLLALVFMLTAMVRQKMPRGTGCWSPGQYRSVGVAAASACPFRESFRNLVGYSSLLRVPQRFLCRFAGIRFSGVAPVFPAGCDLLRMPAQRRGDRSAVHFQRNDLLDGGDREYSRGHGPFVNHDHYSALMELIFPMAGSYRPAEDGQVCGDRSGDIHKCHYRRIAGRL